MLCEAKKMYNILCFALDRTGVDWYSKLKFQT